MDLDQEVVDKLHNLYGEFQGFIKSEPRFRIKEGKSNTYLSQLFQLPAAVKASETKVYWRSVASSYLKKPKR
ncbi:hypothetical protein NIES208_06735 [[Limnothrix rosea] IAM M-220]|nr:hypothetical protein NIES208_06735 [[Limnothrix rosea] IAM M-220]